MIVTVLERSCVVNLKNIYIIGTKVRTFWHMVPIMDDCQELKTQLWVKFGGPPPDSLTLRGSTLTMSLKKQFFDTKRSKKVSESFFLIP